MDKYKVKKYLNKGAFGKIYLVENQMIEKNML